jgi:hypothetical protein
MRALLKVLHDPRACSTRLKGSGSQLPAIAESLDASIRLPLLLRAV